MAKGTIKRYDFRKGFGFIADEKSGEDFFFHKSEWQGDSPIRKGLEVKFINKVSDKGPHAESVKPVNESSTKDAASNNTKPASLEERIVSLEKNIGIWKVLNLFAIAGVIALAIERFVL